MIKVKNIIKDDIAKLIPIRAKNSYKNQFGRLLLIGGNKQMGGAIQMSANAAVNTGAGLTTVATDPLNIAAIHSILPETMVCDWQDIKILKQQLEKSNIIVIGPGMGRSQERWFNILRLLNELDKRKIIIIDGDALTLLADNLSEKRSEFMVNHDVILTPHLGEWAQLTDGNVDQTDNEAVQDWVDNLEVTLVLKNEQTRIFTARSDTVLQNTAGNPGMSIGGMGDTLVGMIAGCCGQIKPLVDAISTAVFLHSYIGDEVYADNYIVRPTELASRIPATMKGLRNRN